MPGQHIYDEVYFFPTFDGEITAIEYGDRGQITKIICEGSHNAELVRSKFEIRISYPEAELPPIGRDVTGIGLVKPSRPEVKIGRVY
jgi:hypothetical protein